MAHETVKVLKIKPFYAPLSSIITDHHDFRAQKSLKSRLGISMELYIVKCWKVRAGAKFPVSRGEKMEATWILLVSLHVGINNSQKRSDMIDMICHIPVKPPVPCMYML